jgi:DNA-binding MarR family transcriptional regulator
MNAKSAEKIREMAATISTECLAMRVRYLNRSLTSIYDNAFRPLGITASQVNLLVAIVQRGDLSPGQLGTIFSMEKSTLSRNLERMRKAGWVETGAPVSGRTHSIHATELGRTLLSEVFPRWQEAQTASNQLLGTEGCDALRQLGDSARDSK